jgi:hypothetical protein
MFLELTDCTAFDLRMFFRGLPTDLLSIGSICDGKEGMLRATL